MKCADRLQSLGFLIGATTVALLVGSLAIAQDIPPDDEPLGDAPDEPGDPLGDEPAPDDTAEPGAEPAEPTEPAGDEPLEEPAPEPEPEPAETGDEPDAAPPAALGAVPDEAAPPDDDDVEEIVVTGSRIKRSVFSTAGPVAVMTRKQIDQSGASNMADLIQNLTVAASSGFLGNPGAGAGTARINLRGLGSGATLVLINGRRTVSSAAGVTLAFVDIATMPLAVVERIEILTSGASAIYGTNALAGVINIITRNNWEGLRVQLDGKATTKDFDYREATASAAFGATGERGRVLAGLQYFRASQLLATNRPFTYDQGPMGGQGGNRTPIGHPGTFVAGGGLVPDPNCEAGPTSINDGTFCNFSFNEFIGLTPDVERTSVYAHGSYDISDYTEAYLEANISKTRSENVSSSSFRLLPTPLIPAGHIDNSFGEDVRYVGRAVGFAGGSRTASSDDDTLRTAVGLKGDFEGIAPNTVFEDWGWELMATFGVSQYARYLPDDLAERFQQAVDSCSDPSDLDECFNPFYTSVLGTGTPNPRSVVDRVTRTTAQISTVIQHLQTYGLNLDGSLFELPGGDLGFALGGELRKSQRSSQLDYNANQFDWSFYLGNDDLYNERDVIAGYLELLWPILQGTELQTAVRVENYSEGWTEAVPGGGLTMGIDKLLGAAQGETVTGLTLRASVSRAFRAPTLAQASNGSTTIPLSIDTGGTSPVYLPIRREGDPDLDPQRATAITAGLTWEPFEELRVRADYWNYTITDFIQYENEQQKVNAWLMEGMPEDPGIQVGDGGLVERITVKWQNLPGSITTDGIDLRARLNLDSGGAGIFGLGVDGSYTLSYNIPAELVPKVSEDAITPGFCSGDTCNVAGNLNGGNIANAIPTWRLNLPVTWTMDEHFLNVTLHVMSPLEDWHPSRYMNGPRDIDSFVTLDLQYSLTLGNVIGKKTKLRVGAINLLDQAPPFVDVTNGFAATLHDPRGRMVYASLEQEL